MPYAITQPTAHLRRLLLPPDQPERLTVLDFAHRPPVPALGPVALVAGWDDDRGRTRHQILAIACLLAFTDRRRAASGLTAIPRKQCPGLTGLYVGLVSALVSLPEPIAFRTGQQVCELPESIEQQISTAIDNLAPEALTLSQQQLADEWLGFTPAPAELL